MLSGMDEAAVAALRDLYSDLQIDGRVLDLGGDGQHHFEVPPDELVEFDGPDVSALPYPDGAFDDVVCLLGGRNAAVKGLDEVARVLKPGGHFVCAFVGGADDSGRMRKLRKAFDAAPAFAGAQSDLRTSLTGSGDRLWAVWAARRP
jgi:SAM-dependent methyltransferase